MLLVRHTVQSRETTLNVRCLVQSPVLVSPQTPKSYHSQLYSNTSLPHSMLFIRFRLSVKERGGGVILICGK